LNTDLKIILLDQNYVERLNINDNAAKNFLATSLNNYILNYKIQTLF